ncbi:MAG: hypothetical protein V2I57_00595 [Xanthomonadales bacterium]|jgi:hypothetical protein|nr:hypothetical protein [Xanthomonadales bacterium]
MTDTHRAAIEAVLQPGETLEWSGGPDPVVMKKTLGKRKRKFPLAGLGIAVIVVVVLVMNAGDVDWAGMIRAAPHMAAEAMETRTTGLSGYLPFLIAALVVGGIFWLRRRQAGAHVDNLSYGITDRRVLIVRKGEIYESWNPAELQRYEMNERVGAEGFHDIIWGRRRLSHSSDDSRPSPLELEKARVGFKALPDGPAVLARLDAWRKAHDRQAEQASRAVLAEDAAASGALERLVHPRLGFSIELPTSWDTHVRYKKLVFGKFGIDTTTDRWSTPEAAGDWNVVLAKDAMNAEVMLEVAETPPTVTLDGMTNSRAFKMFAREAELFDRQPELKIGGMPGFGFSMRLPGSYSPMVSRPGKVQAPSRDGNDERFIVLYQAVLHDGRYQYYLRAIWAEGDTLQEQACRRMLGSLHGVSSAP